MSQEFQTFYHWYFSAETDGMRARDHIPDNLLHMLHGQEFQIAMNLFYEKFDSGYGHDYYIKAILSINDTGAIPHLKTLYKILKKKHNKPVSYEERMDIVNSTCHNITHHEKLYIVKHIPMKTNFASELRNCHDAIRKLKKMDKLNKTQNTVGS